MDEVRKLRIGTYKAAHWCAEIPVRPIPETEEAEVEQILSLANQVANLAADAQGSDESDFLMGWAEHEAAELFELLCSFFAKSPDEYASKYPYYHPRERMQHWPIPTPKDK